MSLRYTTALVLALTACGTSGRGGRTGGNNNGTDGGTSQGPGGNTNPTGTDCANSVEINGNGIDDDCDGQVDNAAPCDTATVGQNTADALTKAIGLCSSKFITAAKLNGPSVDVGRDTTASFGSIPKLEGSGMAVLSNGLAKVTASYLPQPGTQQDSETGMDTSYPSPYASLAAPPNGCGGQPADTGNDYEELETDLTIPNNVNSFSLQFQFLSAEYPEYVCSQFNDRFLVIVDDGVNPQQVAFDSKMNPVTINSGFFTVCQNGGTTETNNCTTPVTAIAGTGYDNETQDLDPMSFMLVNEPIGGSTGWLTTTVPVTPGDHIKLRFVIYDESDSKYDSTVLIDNFQWLAGAVSGPVTIN